MTGTLWVVVGGGDKGGIVVRSGKDVTSDVCSSRLSTGAFVQALEVEGERLRYERVTGSGPATGWVSTRLPDKDLLVEADRVWEVVGGGDKGGIVVRTGLDTASPPCPERLSTGSLVRELGAEGLRVRYRRVTGSGPEEGWVSSKLVDGKELLARPKALQLQPAEATKANDQVATVYADAPQWWLELPTSNPETGFSYEGYPSWVPVSATTQRLWRENRAFLPPPPTPLARLERAKPLAPWRKLPPKKLKEMSAQSLPGCMFGLALPKTSGEMASAEYGAEWLTRAFRAAGTISEDNRVTKLLDVRELPTSGFDTAGGAAMKMILTVEYLKPDRELHTTLFVKYPYLYEVLPTARQEVSGYSDIDGPEIMVSMRLQHLFPFRTAKFYFCDVCRETTNWILITEAIDFGRRGKVENGKITEDIKYGPYDILPVCGKYQDWLLPNPLEFYCCLFRAMGRLSAWDKLGRYDGHLGPAPKYKPEEYLFATYAGRAPQTSKAKSALVQTVGKMIDKAIDFVMNVANNVADASIQDMQRLTKMRDEMMEMAPYLGDMSQHYQASDTDYMGAMHANLQADNAFFWRDDSGDLDCGAIDWGGFQRMPFGSNFLGCLSGAEPAMMKEHEGDIIQTFVDEHHRSGGPKLDTQELTRRYHLAYMSFVYEATTWIERDILKLTTKEAIMEMRGVYDPAFQGNFRVRCRSTTIFNAFQYYQMRGDFKSTFDTWAQGVGKPYMTVYE